MELDLEFILADAATKLGTSVAKLIQCGAHGKLTISVVANDWASRAENGTAETISGLVTLVPDDLLQSYGADFTRIRQVVTHDDGEVVTLRKPIDVNHAVHFVTAEEFERFRSKYAGFVGRGDGIPPYLDDSHYWYSPKLAAAVQAWMALFADGNFRKGPKGAIDQIESWLMSNTKDLSPTARGYISKVVNPKKTKDGGAPPIPVK